MLARVRSCFLLSFLIVFFAVLCLPVQAQVNGVPASVTSLGFGGSHNPAPGVRSSVTSLGPNGYGNTWPLWGNCCANFFLPANPNPPLFSGHHHRRHDDRSDSPVGIIEPVYIPYAVPYAPETDDDPADADADYAQAAGPKDVDPRPRRTRDRDAAPKAVASAKPTSGNSASTDPAPAEPEQPVAAQPATVLIFKDGHQSDVLNYAIVGDTLFDFTAGRTHKILLADLDLPATHKANDDRGVDFQIPVSKKKQ